MSLSEHGRGCGVSVLILVTHLALPALATAQGGVGSGPLTGALTDTEPTSGVFSLGFLKVAPGLTIRELGFDDNVFDESVNPKEDWVVAGTPDVSGFIRLPWIKASAYGGAEMQYYHKYDSERAITPHASARVDLLLSRVFPFVGAGETKSRTRPNGEIDVRANQVQDELSGGVGFELSTHARAFVAMIRTKNKFENAAQNGVDLDQSLSRVGTEYQGGVQTDLTPLLTMQVRGGYHKDEFKLAPARDGDSRTASAMFQFSPAAVVNGTATIGFQDYKPVDPLVRRFRGVTGSGFIGFSLLELARVTVGYNRSMEYSFDVVEAYFLQSAFNAAYTMPLFGAVDWQARGSLSLFDYGNREGSNPRRDSYEEVGASLGYNLKVNKTRVAINYEYAERRSPEVASRNYIRRRTYLNWAFVF